ncbi:MAG: ChaN family lipoprotein [Elusimicrobia bacterium]|nr:ChaN family lipoprotein [Elusimicrobiota bacterium]
MKRLIGFVAAVALIIAGAHALRKHQHNKSLSPVEQEALRDALSDDPSGQLPQLPKLQLTGASVSGADASRYLDDPVLIAAHVKTHAEALDWQKVFAGPERLIYLGERHPDARPKRELDLHLREAAAAGITHLAIEMLGEDRRSLLKRYEQRKAQDAELVEAFMKDWGPKDRGFMPEEYAKVLASAREAGIHIEPLDFAMAEKDKMWRICVKQKSEKQCDDEELQNRDNQMMSSLNILLSKPETGRVLAWTGTWHACQLEGAAKLAARGVSSRSYYLVTKGLYEHESGIIRYLDAVEKFGWRSRSLLIHTQGVQACFVGLISLPDADVSPARRDP